MATFSGHIDGRTDEYNYERRRNNGTIRSKLINTGDPDLTEDSDTVNQSTDMTTITANNDAVIQVSGETGSGFAFTSGSQLRVRGNVIISNALGQEQTPLRGINTLTVNSGHFIIIIGNEDIICIDESNDDYNIIASSPSSTPTPPRASTPVATQTEPQDDTGDTGFGDSFDMS